MKTALSGKASAQTQVFLTPTSYFNLLIPPLTRVAYEYVILSAPLKHQVSYCPFLKKRNFSLEYLALENISGELLDFKKQSTN